MAASHFRALLIASLIFSALGAVIDTVFPGLLPEPFSKALQLQDEAIAGPWVYALLALALLLLAALVASVVGLYLFRPWSRPLAVGMTIVAVVLVPFFGAVAESGIASAAMELSSLLWGAVLAVAYFSPLAETFKRRDA